MVAWKLVINTIHNFNILIFYLTMLWSWLGMTINKLFCWSFALLQLILIVYSMPPSHPALSLSSLLSGLCLVLFFSVIPREVHFMWILQYILFARSQPWIGNWEIRCGSRLNNWSLRMESTPKDPYGQKGSENSLMGVGWWLEEQVRECVRAT